MRRNDLATNKHKHKGFLRYRLINPIKLKHFLHLNVYFTCKCNDELQLFPKFFTATRAEIKC